MSVDTLRVAISKRSRELKGVALLAAGLANHTKRKGSWRTCPCSWCSTKREATIVIGSHVPKVWEGHYVEDIRDAWRESMREKYRAVLKSLSEE